MPTLLNLTAFNVLWLVIVSSAFLQQDLFGLAVLALWLPFHFRYSRCPNSDARLILVTLLCGPLIDTWLVQGGLMSFAGQSLAAHLPPYWIYGLWVNFAITLNHSLRWLRGRYFTAAGFGAIAAPVAYFSGANLGAATIAEPAWQALAFVSVAWALLLPGLISLTDKKRVDSAQPDPA